MTNETTATATARTCECCGERPATQTTTWEGYSYGMAVQEPRSERHCDRCHAHWNPGWVPDDPYSSAYGDC